jgi:hypothetical protein
MSENRIVQINGYLIEGLTPWFIDRHAKIQLNGNVTTPENESRPADMEVSMEIREMDALRSVWVPVSI